MSEQKKSWLQIYKAVAAGDSKEINKAVNAHVDQLTNRKIEQEEAHRRVKNRLRHTDVVNRTALLKLINRLQRQVGGTA